MQAMSSFLMALMESNTGGILKAGKNCHFIYTSGKPSCGGQAEDVPPTSAGFRKFNLHLLCLPRMAGFRDA